METIEKVFNLLTETPRATNSKQTQHLAYGRLESSQFFKATRFLNRGQNTAGLSLSSVNEIERR